MSKSRWFRFAPLAFLLAACAQSTSLDEIPDDDAGIVRPGDDDDGAKDASIDATPEDSGKDSATNEEAGACEGVVCDSPPADSCDDTSTLRTYASSGTCDEGECSYASTTEECQFGCDTGACKPNPCAGKVCNTPPAKACADANNLRVYEPNGTCDNGQCDYASSTQPCAGGCANGACIDNPCAGVTCNSPPVSRCRDESYLTVFEAPGSCSGGTCSYGSHDKYCAFGCANDLCNGDPCEGIVCNQPPASYCSGPDTLYVYESTGTCADGICSYKKLRDEYCGFGCNGGKCNNDPCAGKACNTPPARDCKDANTARAYASPGTCSGGSCSYQEVLTSCPYGCANGLCKNCSIDADCGSGKFCNNATCATCNTDNKCGASCQDCGALGKKCSNGACVECTLDSQCGSGKRCQNNVCVTCNTSNACGASCVTCPSGTFCDGTQCVCDANSCGAGAKCTGTSCVTCNTAGSCGPSCVTCSGTTPVCGGATVGCQCTEASCGSGNYCTTSGTCASCGPAACGNGRCDCGESYATCPSDCPPPCPTGLVIGTWTSGDDGWTWPKTGADGDYIYDFWVRRPQSSPTFMGGGNANKLQGSYTQDLTYGTNVNLLSCGSATLSFEIMFSDDTSRGSDKSERLYVQCSGDGGASWSNLRPNPWPANQSQCGTSYCSGSTSSGRSFPWTAQTIALPPECRTATTRFRFRAEGSHPFNMQNPGWSLRDVKVN